MTEIWHAGILGCVLTVVGCASHEAYLSGNLAIRVVDGIAHTPIAGARVVISRPDGSSVLGQTTSNEMGVARMLPIKGRVSAALIGDSILPPVKFEVIAAGYRPFSVVIPGAASTPSPYYHDPGDTQLGVVILSKL